MKPVKTFLPYLHPEPSDVFRYVFMRQKHGSAAVSFKAQRIENFCRRFAFPYALLVFIPFASYGLAAGYASDWNYHSITRTIEARDLKVMHAISELFGMHIFPESRLLQARMPEHLRRER